MIFFCLPTVQPISNKKYFWSFLWKDLAPQHPILVMIFGLKMVSWEARNWAQKSQQLWWAACSRRGIQSANAQFGKTQFFLTPCTSFISNGIPHPLVRILITRFQLFGSIFFSFDGYFFPDQEVKLLWWLFKLLKKRGNGLISCATCASWAIAAIYHSCSAHKCYYW